MTITLGITASLGTVGLTVESTIHHTHSIGHALDELPKDRTVAVVADSLRFELKSMGQFMEQYTPCFKIYLCGVVTHE